MAQTARRPGLLGAALGFATAAAVVYAVFVWTRTGQSLDAELLHRAPQGGEYEQVTALAAPAKTVLTFFGDKMTLLALVAAILLAGTASSRARAGVAGVLVPLFGRHRERAEGCARAARLRRHGVDHAQQLSERSRRRRSRPAAGDAGRGTVADALVGCRAGGRRGVSGRRGDDGGGLAQAQRGRRRGTDRLGTVLPRGRRSTACRYAAAGLRWRALARRRARGGAPCAGAGALRGHDCARARISAGRHGGRGRRGRGRGAGGGASAALRRRVGRVVGCDTAVTDARRPPGFAMLRGHVPGSPDRRRSRHGGVGVVSRPMRRAVAEGPVPFT